MARVGTAQRHVMVAAAVVFGSMTLAGAVLVAHFNTNANFVDKTLTTWHIAACAMERSILASPIITAADKQDRVARWELALKTIGAKPCTEPLAPPTTTAP